MGQADFSQGNPIMVDHTAAAAIVAGDVVVQGDIPMIAHTARANGALGALAAQGGIYKVAGDALIAIGKKVYWDDTANKVTETSTGNKVFGYTTDALIGADTETGFVMHNPAM